MTEDLRPRIALDHAQIEEFCRKWQIVEFSLFGSVLTNDFRPDSDVDVLVTFAKNAKWSTLHLHRMEQVLAQLTGRPVDLLTKRGVESMENYIRRDSILRGTRVYYAA